MLNEKYHGEISYNKVYLCGYRESALNQLLQMKKHKHLKSLLFEGISSRWVFREDNLSRSVSKYLVFDIDFIYLQCLCHPIDLAHEYLLLQLGKWWGMEF